MLLHVLWTYNSYIDQTGMYGHVVPIHASLGYVIILLDGIQLMHGYYTTYC